MIDEVWKDVPGREGIYQVSDKGRVRSLSRLVTNRGGRWGRPTCYRLPGRILKPCTIPNGYRRVVLSSSGRMRGFYVHHLVLLAFIGPRPAGHECCHGNRDKTDNHLGNLRWGTKAENAADTVRHGLSPKGERNGSAKLTAAAVRSIRAAHACGTTLADLARQHGVTKLNIRAVILRRTWKHV